MGKGQGGRGAGGDERARRGEVPSRRSRVGMVRARAVRYPSKAHLGPGRGTPVYRDLLALVHCPHGRPGEGTKLSLLPLARYMQGCGGLCLVLRTSA